MEINMTLDILVATTFAVLALVVIAVLSLWGRARDRRHRALLARLDAVGASAPANLSYLASTREAQRAFNDHGPISGSGLLSDPWITLREG